MTDFSQPLSWTVKLAGHLKGLKNPQVYTVASNGKTTSVTNAKIDAKTSVATFTTTTDDAAVVLAAVAPGFPWNLIVIVVVLIGVIGGVAVLILRRQQKQSYDGYLRSKYYNI